MKWLLCELILTCSLGVEPLSLDELTYRTVLYDYYQENYDDALIGTLVAESQGRTGEDDTRFRLARGSFAFKDGMYGYARETFDSVPAGELTGEDRARLAFHLARVHHQRRDWQGLERELAVLDAAAATLEQPISHPEVTFMRVELALASNDTAAANRHIAALPEDEPLVTYALYNLGVLYREQGDREGARTTFERLAEIDGRAVDSFDLVQRAKLALAYMAREDDASTDAASLIEALPGNGRYREVALASYGNLAMQQEDNELAARIWLTLQKDESWTASATAARLGFPMSLDGIAQPQTILAHYQAAERAFEARLTTLNTLVSSTTDPVWVQDLASAFARSQIDEHALFDLLSEWEDTIGHREWVEWLADEQANKLLTQWQSLDEMKGYLAALPETLESYAEVADEQHRRAVEARRLLQDDGLLQRRTTMTEEIGGLAARLDRLNRPDASRDRAWYSALADADERALLEELWALEDGFETVLTGTDQARWQARVERLLGVVYYQLETTVPKRHRALTRRVQVLEAELLDVDAKVARVQAAEKHFAHGVGANFDQYAGRANAIIARVDDALKNREVALAGYLRERMQRETQRVTQYLFVTRVAIARTTDQLAVATIEEGGS